MDRRIRKDVERMLDEGGRGWRVELVGHSLGAGVAALLGWRWRSATKGLRETAWRRGVEVVGLAMPPVASLPLSRAGMSWCTAYVNRDDVIARVSGASMERLRKRLKEIPWKEALKDELKGKADEHTRLALFGEWVQAEYREPTRGVVKGVKAIKTRLGEVAERKRQASEDRAAAAAASEREEETARSRLESSGKKPPPIPLYPMGVVRHLLPAVVEGSPQWVAERKACDALGDVRTLPFPVCFAYIRVGTDACFLFPPRRLCSTNMWWAITCWRSIARH